jgi:hypothetical protein
MLTRILLLDFDIDLLISPISKKINLFMPVEYKKNYNAMTGISRIAVLK